LLDSLEFPDRGGECCTCGGACANQSGAALPADMQKPDASSESCRLISNGASDPDHWSAEGISTPRQSRQFGSGTLRRTIEILRWSKPRRARIPPEPKWGIKCLMTWYGSLELEALFVAANFKYFFGGCIKARAFCGKPTFSSCNIGPYSSERILASCLSPNFVVPWYRTPSSLKS
jgi:hypothetical protein